MSKIFAHLKALALFTVDEIRPVGLALGITLGIGVHCMLPICRFHPEPRHVIASDLDRNYVYPDHSTAIGFHAYPKEKGEIVLAAFPLELSFLPDGRVYRRTNGQEPELLGEDADLVAEMRLFLRAAPSLEARCHGCPASATPMQYRPVARAPETQMATRAP